VLQIVPFIAYYFRQYLRYLVITTLKGGLSQANYQVCAEMLYTFITSLVQTTSANGAKYISIVFTVFLYILTANLLGLIPPLVLLLRSNLLLFFV
jgi:F0F1-type ATP synthase membrane subunit a